MHPGEFVVLGRNADPALNGGVALHYQYTGVTLANNADDLILIAPWGEVIDTVIWGAESGFRVRAGVSFERVAWDSATGWVYAHGPWPGSAGDWGSPGGPYIAPTPTPLPTEPPTATPHPAQPPQIRISELMIDSDAVSDNLGEETELYIVSSRV